MGDRQAEMTVETLSETLPLLATNTLVDTLTDRLAKVKVNTLGNIYFHSGG